MLVGCVLLGVEGCNFHPGPPDGPAFEGLVSFMVLKEAFSGGGAYVVHPDVEQPIPVAALFIEARNQLGTPDMDAIHLWVQPEDDGKWTLKGEGFMLPPSPLVGPSLLGMGGAFGTGGKSEPGEA